MDSSKDQPQPRPYRSKRHRPCDVCRRRKHACYLDDQPPCRVCKELGTDCTFNEPPSKRRRQSRLPPPATPPSLSTGFAESTELENGEVEAEVEIEVEAEAEVETDAGPESWHSPTRVTSAPDCSAEEPVINYFTTNGDTLAREIPQPSHHDIWYSTSTMLDPELGALSLAFTEGLSEATYSQDHLFPMLNQLPLPDLSHDVTYGGTSQQASWAQPRQVASQLTHSQPTQALDPQDGSRTAQYFGLSGPTDPYLLRHMRFSEEGSCNFGQFQYRRLAPGHGAVDSIAPQAQLPFSFLISASKQPLDTGFVGKGELHASRIEVDKLLEPELGARLVGLFLRYNFPSLPVLSRSQLKVRTMTLVPKAKQLEILPPYLLAAIYAAANQFRRYDPVLNASQTDKEFPASRLWTIAYDGIVQNMHVPQLAVIQALLIYLQRPPEEIVANSADIQGHWPLLGQGIHVANQLGLYVDCNSWSIPKWEKRLRRRLWWAVYSESAWRSLLFGFPQTIHDDEWDVDSLQEDDFVMDHLRCPTEETSTQAPALQKPCVFCHAGYDFRFLVELALISSDTHKTFYTLKATKLLSDDFDASSGAGSILLQRLDEWQTQLPRQMALDTSVDDGKRDYFHSGSAAQVKIAFLTLKVLVYRAMLRPLTNPMVQDAINAGLATMDQSSQGTRGQRPSTAFSTHYNGDASSRREDVFQGALTVVKQASHYAQQLSSYDLNSFSRSWSRGCFATISNFILLLLVIAPSASGAREALAVLARWVIVLREQSIIFQNMQPGLLRLDAVFRLGLEKTFNFPAHVKDSVQRELPTPSYKK